MPEPEPPPAPRRSCLGRLLRAGTALAGLLFLLLLAIDNLPPRRGAAPDPTVLRVDLTHAEGRFERLHGDHYDLSMLHLKHLEAPGLREALVRLSPRSLRCSVARWEIGHEPPAHALADTPAELALGERELYRGSDELVAADDPANYDFGYLDRMLDAVATAGFEPFLCFDSMPVALARVKARGSQGDLAARDPKLSFSNGIRTSPPAHPEVYGRVVRNTLRHLRGRFGGGRERPVHWVEIGNEPDLADPGGEPLRIFWNGSRPDFLETYAAVARELQADELLRDTVRLGAASFGLPGTELAPTFLEEFLGGVAAGRLRLDFVSFHSYEDYPLAHREKLAFVAAALRDAGVEAELVNAEWGRNLEGRDKIYERLDFGLFRSRVMGLMQEFGVVRGHEALLRDPWDTTRLFGLLRHGPEPSKPVTRVYEAMTRLDGLSVRLSAEGPDEGCVLAASDPAGGRASVLVLDGGRLDGLSHPLALQVEGLDPGRGPIKVRTGLLGARSAEAGEPLGFSAEASVSATSTLHLELPADLEGPRLVLWELTGAGVPAPGPVPLTAAVRARGLARFLQERAEREALTSEELFTRARDARDRGDPEQELSLHEAAFRSATRLLATCEVTPSPAFEAALDSQRRLFETLVPRYQELRRGDRVLGLVRDRRASLGELAARARSEPLRARLLDGYLDATEILHRAYSGYGAPAGVARLVAETRAHVTRVGGGGSEQARRVEARYPVP